MTTWINLPTLEGQTPISYNEPGKTYNQATYTYNGKIKTTWNNQVKN